MIKLLTNPLKYQSKEVKSTLDKENLSSDIKTSQSSLTETSNLSAESYKANFMSFQGKRHKYAQNPFNVDEIAQTVNKNYQGKGITDEFGCFDWNKIGWENLRKEPLNWEQAKNNDIIAFYQAMSLAETKDCPRVSKFNPNNVPEPLATFHTIKSQAAQDMHAETLKRLQKIASSNEVPFLDKPLIDKKTGELNIDLTVFDTETTGIKLNPSALDYKTIDSTTDFANETNTVLTGNDYDKILQIGAVKIQKGKIVDEKEIINQLINPEKPIPEQATAVHHITQDMVSAPNVPKMDKVIKDFNNKYLGNGAVVAYNAKFDISMLNNSIFEYNEKHNDKIKPRELCTVIDPFVIIQRLHPFLGSSKKLTDQHKLLFGKDFEGAHDALADATATINILKYCCLLIDKHYHPEKTGKPFTVKDLLTFQFGGEVEGLDIKLQNGYDKAKSFKNSYLLTPVTVKNYPDGYQITRPTNDKEDHFSELSEQIGEQNTQVIMDEMIGRHYKTYSHFSEALENSGIEPFNGLDKKQIIKTIAEQSKTLLNDESKVLWLKNLEPNEKNQQENLNDLPDFEIAKKVMTDNL